MNRSDRPTRHGWRLSTVCGYYRFVHLDGRITADPAQHVRRPKVRPSEGRGMDRSDVARFLFTAEHYDHAHTALAFLLGLNGLRVSEACAANIEDLAFEHGHRTLHIIGKPATIPLAPRSARAIDLAIDERTTGPILRRRWWCSVGHEKLAGTTSGSRIYGCDVVVVGQVGSYRATNWRIRVAA